MISYTDSQLIYLKELWYLSGDWDLIAEQYNKKFSDSKTPIALKTAYYRYCDKFELTDKQHLIENLADLRKTKRRSARLTQQNNDILDNFCSREEILDAVKQAVADLKITKLPKVKAHSRDKTKHLMTMELLLSDLHYGKKTDKFNGEVARNRMRELVRIFIREYHDQAEVFDVEKIIIAILGDIIESYTMHGLESASACEMSNSEQIVLAIRSIFEDVLVPIAGLGVDVVVPCVTGNHDRTEREKTYNMAAKSNVTWIIYNTLADMCEAAKLDNISFNIAENNYLLYSIYDNSCLYEHGDHLKSTSKQAIEAHIAARTKQLGRMIDFMRLGHWHEVTMYEQGRIIINGSLVGQDSYADTRGFNSQAFQVINYYIETATRPNCFYKSFPVYLG